MATSLHAQLVGAYVETPASLRASIADRERLAETMRLIESLDGEAVTLRGEDSAREIVRFARKRNVTKIVVGKPTHPRWHDFVKASFLDDLVRQSHEIDVYVISGGAPATERAARVAAGGTARRPAISEYGAGLAVVGTAALVAWSLFGHTQIADVVMTFLLGVVVVSMRFGYGPSLAAAVVSVLLFDFFFVPPFLSFAVTDLSHIVTFGVMFFVAAVISGLTTRIRDQADRARGRERRTASLFALSRELGVAASRQALLDAAARHAREMFVARVAVLLPSKESKLEVVLADPDTLTVNDNEYGVADWVWLNQRPAGGGTDTLPSARGLYVPLLGSRGRVGVLAVFAGDGARLDDPDERQLLHTVAGLIGSAVERTELADEARRATLRIETEQMRNALLSSVSHDLRTPLGVVTGATSALLEDDAPHDDATRRALLRTAHGEALRLNRLVGNLLDMTRLEAGALKVHKEAQPLEEVIGAALNRVDDRLRDRAVRTDVPADLPLVPLDSVLIEQVLINLLENATKYTPPGSPVDVVARASGREVVVEVDDRGPGVPVADAERVFDKFYRAREVEGGGVGLGLTICRGIVAAHGGRIWVEPRPEGGASFRFTLPLEGPAAAATTMAASTPAAATAR
jgi:two-component system sensor histidine kinase KdpD